MSATGTIYAAQCALTDAATLPNHAVRYSEWLVGVDGGFYSVQSITSAITESTDIAPASNVKTLRIIDTVTTGAYTHTLVLKNTSRAFGDKIEMLIKSPADTTSNVKIMADDGATVLADFCGAGTATNISVEFMFDGSQWLRYR